MIHNTISDVCPTYISNNGRLLKTDTGNCCQARGLSSRPETHTVQGENNSDWLSSDLRVHNKQKPMPVNKWISFKRAQTIKICHWDMQGNGI